MTQPASKRAKSISELQERLQAIRSKKKLTYKEKLVKKGLKNRMKKKSKQDERNAKQKLIRANKLATNEVKNENVENTEKHIQEKKPVFNNENKMVFSKFDFTELGNKQKKKKQPKDPKKILEIIEKQKEKVNNLLESGETKKAIEIKEKSVWKNALAKATGEKVKDDPDLLKKSIRKQSQKKNVSKKKWEARIESVKNAQEERQKKRSENIAKRKKDKKLNKLKKAAKKGKIVPGL